MRRPEAAQWFGALASERFRPSLRTDRWSEGGDRAADRRGSLRHGGFREHAAQPLVRRVAVHARVSDLDVAELGEFASAHGMRVRSRHRWTPQECRKLPSVALYVGKEAF